MAWDYTLKMSIILLLHLKIIKAGVNENRLYEKLFMNSSYNPKVLPNRGLNEPVQVRLSLQMIKLQEVNTRFQFITAIGWIRVLWNDYRLSWNASEFGGVEKIIVPTPDVWVPTFVLANSAAQFLYDEFWYSLFKVVIYSDGTMKWTPGGSFTAHCTIDVHYFPFDEQICQFRFENWVYTGDQVNLTYVEKADDAFIKYYSTPNGQWDVIEVGVRRQDKYFSSPQPYPRVYFGIHVRRKSLFYVTNIILLSIMLGVLVLFMFKLPAESGERISMGVTLLLAFSVFVLMMSESIPETSSAVPVIIIYLVMFMCLTTMGICASVFVLYCYNHNGEQRAPQAMVSFFFNVVPRATCNTKFKTKKFRHGQCDVTNNDPMTSQLEELEMCKLEWQQISRQIDVFCFWLFVSLFVLIDLVLLVIYPMTASGKNLTDLMDNWLNETDE